MKTGFGHYPGSALEAEHTLCGREQQENYSVAEPLGLASDGRQAPKYSLLKFYLDHLARISSVANPLFWSSAQALGMVYLGALLLPLSSINCRLQTPVCGQPGCVLLYFSFMELCKKEMRLHMGLQVCMQRGKRVE